MTNVRTLLVLGASGDLASRLLLPALGQLLAAEPERQLRLVGAGAEQLTAEDWTDLLRTAFTADGEPGTALDAVLGDTAYVQADVTSESDPRDLLNECEDDTAIYFALPPAITVKACEALQRTGVPAGTVLALEKPFGSSAESAHDLNELLLRIVPETHIHRVDHFLGRSTVLNLLGVRFANRMLEPVWNSQHIARVDIVYDEQLGLRTVPATTTTPAPWST